MAIVALEAVLRLAGVESRFGRLLSIRDVPTRNVDGVSIWSSSAPRFTAEDIQRASTNDPATFRILGLGDSIMYGVGQPKDKTYLEQARKNLAGRTRRSVEVLNLAVPGFNTKQEDLVYKELEGQIRPDLVLVHYWGDDGRQYRVVGGYVVDAADISEDGYLVIRALGLPPRVSDFLLMHSRLYDMLTQIVISHARNSEPADFSAVLKPLTNIRQRAQRGGARVVVLVSPGLDKAEPAAIDDLVVLQRFAADGGIEVIDLSQWLKGIESKRIAMDICHFNEEGHRVLGERLADYLLKRDLKE